MLMPLLRTPTASSSKRLLILIWSICTFFFPTFPYLSHFCQCSVDTIQYNNKSVLAAMWMQFIHESDDLLVMQGRSGRGLWTVTGLLTGCYYVISRRECVTIPF